MVDRRLHLIVGGQFRALVRMDDAGGGVVVGARDARHLLVSGTRKRPARIVP
jgi:hypothetical protein